MNPLRLPNQRFRESGLVLVLALLCTVFSVLTIKPHPLGGERGGAFVAQQFLADPVISSFGAKADRPREILVAVPKTAESLEFATRLASDLQSAGHGVEIVTGEPVDARRALDRRQKDGRNLDFIAGTQASAGWLIFANLADDFPKFATVRMLPPPTYDWPTFLMTSNLLNIANQIAVIAIVAIGMTMVVIAGGIDLSVGSLVGLGAMVTAWLIAYEFEAEQTPAFAMCVAAVAGMACTAAIGLATGLVITGFRLPPFIVTLAMMSACGGVTGLMTQGESIYQIPDTFVWLGRRASFGIPNAVWLMMGLYAVAHVVMTRTIVGRYLLASGGNREAARLSGVPVKSITVMAYVVSGFLAGLGGVILASNLKSAAPNYGTGYELSVIAAVVVGGASLSGGRGTMAGTLLGALIIAVIQNGMNLVGIGSYTQRIVLGVVILLAVLLDRWRSPVSADGS